MELADLKKLQSSVEDAARSIEQSVKTGMEDAQKEFQDAQTALENTGAELKKTENEIKQAVSGITMPHMGTASTASADFGIPATEAPAAQIAGPVANQAG